MMSGNPSTIDTPEMRSVTMISPSSIQTATTYLPRSRTIENYGLMRKKSETNTTVVGPWKVDQVEPVPLSYALERTNVCVSEVTARQLATRIATCLREESISAKFDDVKATAEAETRDQIKFIIRLFSDCGKLVVEVQRLKGCAYGYYQVAKAILNAARGFSRKIKSHSARTFRPKDEDQREYLTEVLDIACKMISDRRLDANLLVMESLSQVTATNRSRSRKCQLFLAQNILDGPLFETVKSLIVCNRKSALKNSADEMAMLEEVEEQYLRMMRRHALRIFANCLHILEECGKLNKLLQAKKLCCPNLLASLVNELSMSSITPHDACEAARCLQHLIRVSVEAKKIIEDIDITSAVMGAYRYGLSSHATLEKESILLKGLL